MGRGRVAAKAVRPRALPPLVERPSHLDPRAGKLPMSTAECCWFVGDWRQDWRLQVCCGAPVLFGKPYCAEHHAIAWRAGSARPASLPKSVPPDRTIRHGGRLVTLAGAARCPSA